MEEDMPGRQDMPLHVSSRTTYPQGLKAEWRERLLSRVQRTAVEAGCGAGSCTHTALVDWIVLRILRTQTAPNVRTLAAEGGGEGRVAKIAARRACQPGAGCLMRPGKKGKDGPEMGLRCAHLSFRPHTMCRRYRKVHVPSRPSCSFTPGLPGSWAPAPPSQPMAVVSRVWAGAP